MIADIQAARTKQSCFDGPDPQDTAYLPKSGPAPIHEADEPFSHNLKPKRTSGRSKF